MFNIYRRKALLYLNHPTFSPTLKPYPLFHSPSFTNTSHSPSFALSYIIHNFGFSPQSASKCFSTHNPRFKTAENPDSVLTFFKKRGFSDTQLHNMIQKAQWLLSCDPHKRVLPKFEFFHSKGASTTDIVNLVSKNPIILSRSLKNQIVPTYELVYKFLQSDKDTIALLNCNPSLFGDGRPARNIGVLIENGVTDSNIARLLRKYSRVFSRSDNDLLKVVNELKDMGFDPSKTSFAIALMAKLSVSTTLWNKKSDVFKKWGWSEKDIMEAFRRDPHCMLVSIDKINSVMSFWVNHLGWDALAIANAPGIIGCSLERNIMPRAAVVQFILKKGLIKKNESLTPFFISEKLFVDKFVKQFVEDSSYLLNLYEEKVKVARKQHQGEQ